MRPYRSPREQAGISLIELITFIVVVGISLVAVVQIYGQAVVNSVDPIVRVRATELARATLDEVLARRFDERSPTGGTPPCDSAEGDPCLGISPEAGYDDVGDFNGYTDNSVSDYPVSVSVIEAGGDIGLSASSARKITVTVGMPDGNSLSLAAYKANY